MKTALQTLAPKAFYSKILKMLPICTVDVIFFNQNKTKTLLFKRNNMPLRGVHFSLGGRLFKNEKLIDCAIRQAFREAGLKISKNKLVFGGVQDEIFKNSVFKNISCHSVDVYYGYIISENKTIQLDNQHSKCGWFSVYDKTLHPLIRKKIKTLIKKI